MTNIFFKTMSPDTRKVYHEGKLFLDQMKDKRVACFFKPSTDMSDSLIQGITDTIKHLGIDIKTSTHGADSAYLIVRQDMPVEKRMMIENSIKLFVHNHPTWMVVEEWNGTTYTSMI